MIIDVKKTIWARYELDEDVEIDQERFLRILDDTEDVEHSLKETLGYCPWDADKIKYDYLEDTEEEITVEENGNCYTIEVSEDEYAIHPIWTNAPKQTEQI